MLTETETGHQRRLKIPAERKPYSLSLSLSPLLPDITDNAEKCETPKAETTPWRVYGERRGEAEECGGLENGG